MLENTFYEMISRYILKFIQFDSHNKLLIFLVYNQKMMQFETDHLDSKEQSGTLEQEYLEEI